MYLYRIRRRDSVYYDFNRESYSVTRISKDECDELSRIIDLELPAMHNGLRNILNIYRFDFIGGREAEYFAIKVKFTIEGAFDVRCLTETMLFSGK
jgi:methyl coenzyme M reductase gamma subunit